MGVTATPQAMNKPLPGYLSQCGAFLYAVLFKHFKVRWTVEERLIYHCVEGSLLCQNPLSVNSEKRSFSHYTTKFIPVAENMGVRGLGTNYGLRLFTECSCISSHSLFITLSRIFTIRTKMPRNYARFCNPQIVKIYMILKLLETDGLLSSVRPFELGI